MTSKMGMRIYEFLFRERKETSTREHEADIRHEWK